MATNSKGMKQSNTEYGSVKGETGERIPSKATSSDSSGERKVKVPMQDKQNGYPSTTGAKAPAASKASDSTGEKREGFAGGVGQGMHDKLVGRGDGVAGKHDGHTGELNTGKGSESHFYKHKKADYR